MAARTALLFAVLTNAGGGADAPATENKLMARIGAREIRAADVPAILASLPPLERPRVMDDYTLVAVLRRYLVDESLLMKVRAASPTQRIDAANRREIITACLDAEIERRLQADPPDVEKYFREHIRAFTDPNRAKVRVIKVASRETAEALATRLGGGADFAKAAETESQPIPAADRGGLLRGHADDWGHIAGIGSFPAATKAIFALSPGGVTEVPLTREGAWFLFKLESIERAQNKDLSDPKLKHKVTEACLDARRKELKPQVMREAMQEAGAELLFRAAEASPTTR